MSGSLTVACVQVNAGPEIEPNLRAVGDLILRAREAGADFITTPEGCRASNVCEADDCRGEDVTKIGVLADIIPDVGAPPAPPTSSWPTLGRRVRRN